MSKLLSAVFTILLATNLHHGASGQGYDITITVEGMQDSVAYLGYHFGEQKYLSDTTLAAGPGIYRFTGKTPLQSGIYFLYTPNYYFELIVKDQQFSLSTEKSGAYKELTIQNSPENEIFKEFQLGMTDLQIKRQGLRKELENAESKEDSAAIFERGKVVEQELSGFRKSIIQKYPDSFVAKIVKLMERPEVPQAAISQDDKDRARQQYESYKRSYIAGVDFNDSGLLRTPILKGTVLEFFDKVIPQHPDTINKYADYIMAQVEDQPDAFRFWLVILFNKYQQSKIMGMDAVVVHLAEKYYLTGMADWLAEDDREKLAEEVAFLKPNLIGKQAPQLQLLDTLLSPINLNQLKSEFTILYFYDPDCGHCKKTTPVLLEEYHRMKDSGVEVLGVCIATDIEEWRKYVYENELDWINAADPYVRSNFRRDYNVRTTPQIYVLNKEKKIIAKRLEAEQLSGLIEEYRKRTLTP